jgi:hypothetical protein
MNLIPKKVYLLVGLTLFLAGIFLISSMDFRLETKKQIETKNESQQQAFKTPESKEPHFKETSESVTQNKHPSLDSELQVPIPFGATLPAALMDHGSEDDIPQITEMLISLEQEFFSELRSMEDSGIPMEELWEQLRAKYDERYIALFGQDAYLEATSLAAEEAREDYKTAP